MVESGTDPPQPPQNASHNTRHRAGKCSELANGIHLKCGGNSCGKTLEHGSHCPDVPRSLCCAASAHSQAKSKRGCFRKRIWVSVSDFLRLLHNSSSWCHIYNLTEKSTEIVNQSHDKTFTHTHVNNWENTCHSVKLKHSYCTAEFWRNTLMSYNLSSAPKHSFTTLLAYLLTSAILRLHPKC